MSYISDQRKINTYNENAMKIELNILEKKM